MPIVNGVQIPEPPARPDEKSSRYKKDLLGNLTKDGRKVFDADIEDWKKRDDAWNQRYGKMFEAAAKGQEADAAAKSNVEAERQQRVGELKDYKKTDAGQLMAQLKPGAYAIGGLAGLGETHLAGNALWKGADIASKAFGGARGGVPLATRALIGGVSAPLAYKSWEMGELANADAKDPSNTPLESDSNKAWGNFYQGQAMGLLGGGGVNALTGVGGQYYREPATSANAIATPPTAQGVTNALAVNGAPAQLAGPQAGRADYQGIAKQLGGGDFADRADARDYVKKRIEANTAGTIKLSDAEKAAIRADPEFARLMPTKNASYMRAFSKLPVVGAIAGGTAALLGGSDEATAHQRPDESLVGYRFRRAGETALNALNTGSYYVPVVGGARMAADVGTMAGEAYANSPGSSVTAPPYNPRSQAYSDYRGAVSEARAAGPQQGSYPTVGNSLALQGPDGHFYRALDDVLTHFGGGQR